MFGVIESIGVPPSRNHSLSHPTLPYRVPLPLSTTYCHSRIQQTHQFNIAINFSLKVFTNFSVLNSLLLSLPFARIPSNCSSCEKMNCSASTYSSIVPAKNPVACAAPSASNRYFFPPRGNAGTTMSCLGPALSCATAIRPAAYVTNQRDCHQKLHDADAEMFIPHRVQSDRRGRQILLYGLVGSLRCDKQRHSNIHQKHDRSRQINILRDFLQFLHTRSVLRVAAASHHHQPHIRESLIYLEEFPREYRDR